MKRTTLSGSLPKQNFITRFVAEKKNLVVEIIAALFILLFVYTALSKFFGFLRFNDVLAMSPLIKSFSKIVAWVLPITELAVSALLLVPRTRLWGLYSAFLLMAVFTLYIAYMLAFTPNLPCSCGGVLKQMTWTQHLIFNIFFTLLALTGIILEKKRSKSIALA